MININHLSSGALTPMRAAINSAKSFISTRQWFLPLVELPFMFLWFIWYVGKTQSFDSFYVICSLAGAVGLLAPYVREREREDGGAKYHSAFVALALLFSIAAVLANHSFSNGAYLAVLLMVGGWCTAFNALRLVRSVMDHLREKTRLSGDARFLFDFMLPFGIIATVYLANLFLLQYPGNLSSDSVDQVTQAMTGVFKDHHPFWHSAAISCCLVLASLFSDDPNVGVALYCSFQCLFMAAVYSYAVFTARQCGVPRWAAYVIVLLYAFVPYHIAYSATVWKNVPFAGCVLLFSVALFRCVAFSEKRSLLDLALLFVSGLGFALLQHNGMYAFAACVVVVGIVLRAKALPVTMACASALVVSLVLQLAVLPLLGVKPIGDRESISIPVQQIARAIIDDGIDEANAAELAGFVGVDVVAQKYNPHLSDPVKWSVDNAYYASHKGDFFGLWFRIGLAHPVAYLQAWVDMTKGYWFGGYPSATVCQDVLPNDIGIERGGWPPAQELLSGPISAFYSLGATEPLRSIGLMTWLVLAAACICALQRRTAPALMALPALMCVATLLISTPVFNEFRYVYSLAVVAPVFLLLSVGNRA